MAHASFKRAEDTIGQAQALHTMGVAQQQLGDLEGATRSFARAAELLEQAPGPQGTREPDSGPGGGRTPLRRRGGGLPGRRPSPSGIVDRIAFNTPLTATLSLAEASVSVVRPPKDIGVDRDLDTLAPIAEQDATALTYRLPGRDEAWGSLPVLTEADRQRAGKAWQVGVKTGEKITTFDIGGTDKPTTAHVVEAIYAPRIEAQRWAQLDLQIVGIPSTTFHLTHLYAYSLLLKVGDPHHALGQLAHAEASYRQAAGYSFICNKTSKRRPCGCASRATRSSGATPSTRAEDLTGAKAAVLEADHARPAPCRTSFIYNTAGARRRRPPTRAH